MKYFKMEENNFFICHLLSFLHLNYIKYSTYTGKQQPNAFL